MFTFRQVETVKTFELWVKVICPGMFVTQERAELVETIVATTKEANKVAAAMGGYAVLKV